MLVQGNRIARVTRLASGARSLPVAGVTVIEAPVHVLMPGMVEAHTHFSWNDQPSLDSIQRMPTEEHILWCAHIAERYLSMGWTSCVGAATAKPRLDVVIRNAINAGEFPGPRYIAASQEITVQGGLGDNTLPHLPQPEFNFGAVVSGPEEVRRCVRQFVKYGVDQIKINLSGEGHHRPGPSTRHFPKRKSRCASPRPSASVSASRLTPVRANRSSNAFATASP